MKNQRNNEYLTKHNCFLLDQVWVMSPLDYGVDELTSTGKMISWKDEGVDSSARGQGTGTEGWL